MNKIKKDQHKENKISRTCEKVEATNSRSCDVDLITMVYNDIRDMDYNRQDM